MKSSHKFWLVVVFVPLGIVFITAVLPNFLFQKHPEPIDTSKMGEPEKLFNQEADRIALPVETEISDRTSLTRHDIDIVVVTREYRTTLEEKDFRRDIIKQMIDNGWSDLGAGHERVAASIDVFCKKDYDATLMQRQRALWHDEYYYYQLSFDSRLDRIGPAYYGKILPEECLTK